MEYILFGLAVSYKIAKETQELFYTVATFSVNFN